MLRAAFQTKIRPSVDLSISDDSNVISSILSQNPGSVRKIAPTIAIHNPNNIVILFLGIEKIIADNIPNKIDKKIPLDLQRITLFTTNTPDINNTNLLFQPFFKNITPMKGNNIAKCA